MSKIITPAPTQEETPAPSPIVTSLNRLTLERAQEMHQLLSDYRKFKDQTLHTRESDAAREGTTAALMAMLLEYAPELLGAWVTIKEEYEPLCNGINKIFQRIDTNRFAHMQRLQAAAEAAAKVPKKA